MNGKKPKITYILGAGASVGTKDEKENFTGLPCVESFPKRLRQFCKELKNKGPKDFKDKVVRNNQGKYLTQTNEEGHLTKEEFELLKKLLEDVLWLAKGTQEFGTPDTYAKYLFLTNKDDFLKLKKALAFYFMVEQSVNKRFDERALVFLTTLMERHYHNHGACTLSDRIKILNWNYDYQVQISCNEFKNAEIDFYPKPEIPERDIEQLKNSIQMLHLNGIAGLYRYEGRNEFRRDRIETIFDKNLSSQTLKDIVDRFKNSENKNHLINFAWEKGNTINKNFLEIAKAIIKDTDILVVVGYSFPFFNRKVDNEIFKALRENKNLKIYFQNPTLTGENLKNQFQLEDSIANNIEHIKDCNNYFIPFEF